MILTELTEDISKTKQNTADLLNTLNSQEVSEEPEVKGAMIELLQQVKQFHVTCINEIQKHSV